MINKNKIHFYRLSFIFIAMIIISLLLNWGYSSRNIQSEKMMSQSMGKMMSAMHLSNIKIADLYSSEVGNKNGMSMDSNHHDSDNSAIKNFHYITTGIIIVLLPFIVGGAIFLAIIWIK